MKVLLNLERLNQEDLQDGRKGPNSRSQGFQFDQIRPTRNCGVAEKPVQDESHSINFATEPHLSDEKQ
jgi:hypothetical protein